MIIGTHAFILTCCALTDNLHFSFWCACWDYMCMSHPSFRLLNAGLIVAVDALLEAAPPVIQIKLPKGNLSIPPCVIASGPLTPQVLMLADKLLSLNLFLEPRRLPSLP